LIGGHDPKLFVWRQLFTAFRFVSGLLLLSAWHSSHGRAQAGVSVPVLSAEPPHVRIPKPSSPSQFEMLASGNISDVLIEDVRHARLLVHV